MIFRVLAAGLLVALPLILARGFSRQFSSPKILLAEVLAIMGGAVWLLGVLAGKFRAAERSRLTFPLALLAAAVLLSCWNSPVPRFSLEESFYFLCGPLWLLVVVSLTNGEEVGWLGRASALAGSAVALVALLQWWGHDPLALGGYQADLRGLSSRMRIYSTLGNPNFVAGYLVGTVFLAAALATLEKSRPARAAWALAAGAMLAAILGTASLGAWAGGLAGLAAAALVLGRSGARAGHAKPSAGGALSGGAIPAAFLLAGSFDFVLRRLEGRLYLWRIGWPMFSAHPILGSGWGTFQLYFLDLQAHFLAAHPAQVIHWTNAQSPHNDPLQLLLEAGLLGLAAFVWLLTAYAREVRGVLAQGPSRSERIWLAATAGGATALLADSLFNFQFAVPPTFILLFTLLAFPSLIVKGRRATASGEAAIAPPARGPWVRALTAVAVAGVALVLIAVAGKRAAGDWDYAAGLGAESRGELAPAAAAYRRGLRFNALDGRLHFALARVLYLQGDYSQGLLEALAAERTYRDSHLEVLKARIEDALGMAGPALAAYRRALYLDPTLKTVEPAIRRLER
jgi:O-antigen ligase